VRRKSPKPFSRVWKLPWRIIRFILHLSPGSSCNYKPPPGASIQLEIIAGRPPEVLPYLEPDFWKPFPKTPAWEFAGFVALAKRGQPFLGDMVIGEWSNNSRALEAALREQPRTNIIAWITKTSTCAPSG
jgi:hypothetical protein